MTLHDTRGISAWAEAAARGAWFASAPVDLREALIASGEPFELPAGRRLFRRGDPCDGIYCVANGSVRITGLTDTGDEALLVVLEAPQWFGEIALFDRQPRTHDAWAETESRLVRIPLVALERLLDARPVHWHYLGLLVTQKLRLVFTSVEEAALLAPTARIARRLAMIATAYGMRAGQSQRAVAVSQAQLGALLSLSRQTVNQALGALEAAGAIRRSRGRIEIVDPGKLVAVAPGIGPRGSAPGSVATP